MFWDFMEVRCQSCQEPILIKRRAEELFCECPNCSEISRIPPASRYSFRQRPVVLTLVSLVGLVLLAGVGVLAYVGNQLTGKVTNREVVERTDEALKEFLAGNYQPASEHYQVLARERGLSIEERFRLAECYAALGDRDNARKAMLELSEFPIGIATPAHFWLARDLLSQPQMTPSEVRDARSRLQLIVAADPYAFEAQRMLLKMNLSEGRLRSATAQLRVLAGTSDVDRLALAAAYRAMGELKNARHEASQVLKSALAAVETGDPAVRLLAARAAMVLGDFPLAEDLLRAGWAKKVRNPELPDPEVSWSAALTELYLAWSQEVSLGIVAGPPELTLLENALTLTPDSDGVYRRLLVIALGPDLETSRKAFEMLNEGLSRGGNPGMFHTLLGTVASQRLHPDEAVLHFRLALAANPHNALAMNNLASEMTWQPNPDLEGALELIDRALQIGPDLPEMRETRGQILAAMGRLTEALSELSATAEHLPNDIRLHGTLADIYHRLEMPLIAREHRDRAAQLSRPTLGPVVQPGPKGSAF